MERRWPALASAVARALANGPRLLLADEPTGELDEATGRQIAALLDRVNHDGTALVIVTHDADLAAEFVLPFPVDWLGRVEIARMMETAADFEHPAESASAHVADSFLCARKKRKLGRTADEPAKFAGGVADFARRDEVDAEWLFREEIFAGTKHVEIERLVQVMRHGDIDDVNVRAGQKFRVVRGEEGRGGNGPKPLQHRGADIRNTRKHRLRRHVLERTPAGKSASRFVASTR